MRLGTRFGGWGTTRVAGSNRRHLVAFVLVCLAGLTFPACNTAAMRQPPPQVVAEPHVPLQAPPAALSQDQRDLAPMRLVIPRVSLDAGILALGPDQNGAMQAPRRGGPRDPIWSQVYWWKVGAIPGQVGNAVIAGHVNRPDGSPSTFTYLNKLHVGDSIEVLTAGEQMLLFRVTEKATPSTYVSGSTDPTMGRIFGPALEPQLNLITCWGQWDGKEYDRRLVIYSTLVLATTAAPSSSNGPQRKEQR